MGQNARMGMTKAPPLDEQLCFDLYAASRAVTAAYRPTLTRLGITYPQYLVLIVLWEHESCAVRDLAARLRLDHGTLTPLLKRMEAGGLVERRRDHSDERLVVVSLAPQGEALRQHAEAIHCDMVEQLGLVKDEFERLQETLRLLTARVSPAAS
jgi:MarR family transcriptional regulator, organic hydroperoxide resistance regulator